MKFLEISGDDIGSVNTAIDKVIFGAAGVPVERFDAAKDAGTAIVTAASTVSLFGSERLVIVRNAQKFTVDSARKLLESSADSTVVFTGSPGLSAAVRKALPLAESSVYKVPDLRGSKKWVKAILEEYSVSAEPDVASSLEKAAVTQIGAWRVRSLLQVCQILGIDEVSPELANDFFNDLSVPAAVWAIGNHVAQGNVFKSFIPGDVEPVVALSIVAGKLAKLGAFLESSDSAELIEATGMSAAAAKSVNSGVVAGLEAVSAAYDVIMEASALCRQLPGEIERRAAGSSACSKAALILAKGA